MAYLDGGTIQAAVRDVLEDAHGNSRVITADTYRGGIFEGLAQDGESLRALVKPRVDPSVRVIGRHEASPSIVGSFSLMRVEVTVRLVRHMNNLHKLDDDQRDAVYGLAARDADVLRQALTYPGNLTQDASATSTGLVSGMLHYEGSEDPDIDLDEEDPATITTVHTFSGVVKVNQ